MWVRVGAASSEGKIMHELGVVFHVIKKVEEVAAENNITEINSVTLEIGEVSTVIEEYLRKCWKWSVEKKSTMMQNTELLVEKIPDMEARYSSRDRFLRACLRLMIRPAPCGAL